MMNPINRNAFVTSLLALVTITALTHKSNAEDYGSAIDAQSEVMRKIMEDFVEVQDYTKQYWANMPPRERYLRSSANREVENFKQLTDRYPAEQDSEFVNQVLEKLKVKNQAEINLVRAQISSYVKSSRKSEAMSDKICRAAKNSGFAFADCS